MEGAIYKDNAIPPVRDFDLDLRAIDLTVSPIVIRVKDGIGAHGLGFTMVPMNWWAVELIKTREYDMNLGEFGRAATEFYFQTEREASYAAMVFRDAVRGCRAH